MAKSIDKKMLDIMKTGVVWGTTQSVVGSLPASTPLARTTRGFAQSGMSLMYIKDISKKIKL